MFTFEATSPLPRPIKVFVTLCVIMEGVALIGMLAGFGFGIRNAQLMLGGFWPDLLKGASPAFAGQPVVMFGTSAVLHGGPLHLFMNMMGLMWLGPIIVKRVGNSAFWPIAVLSTLGAGSLFAVLTTSGVPMVGASGVLFGLLGTVATWEVLDRIKRRESLAPLVQPAGVFLALNMILSFSSGSIAWEAHLGGFLAGAMCGVLTWQRPRKVQWL